LVLEKEFLKEELSSNVLLRYNPTPPIKIETMKGILHAQEGIIDETKMTLAIEA
jgi:hypothetical protein